MFFQAAQQERSTFLSSLLPLLQEYSPQPAVFDAQSIVSNLKVCLVDHFPTCRVLKIVCGPHRVNSTRRALVICGGEEEQREADATAVATEKG